MRTMNLRNQGKNPNAPTRPLSNNILTKLDPETRKQLGQLTAREATEKNDRDLERQMHVEVARELYRNRIYFIEARMDKRSTIKVGHPDFTCILKGYVFLIELKVKGGRPLSSDQLGVIDELRQSETEVLVAYSSLEAIGGIHAWLDRIGARHRV